MSATPSPAIGLDGVSVRYGSRRALQEVTLGVEPGEFVALAGPNGSGKTTLLRVLLGFLAPDSGRATLLGDDLRDLPIRERARRVAWVPQEESPRDDVPILDYVLYGRYAHLGPLEAESPHDRAVAIAALASVGLADRAGDGILSISGGERQRAILARALAQEAPVLLLDEPTTHLDIGHQLDLLERVQALSREQGVTVIAALHDLNLAARFADRIVVLSRGRVHADGSAAVVLSEELLARVWGVAADLRRDPRSGAPYLLPHRNLPAGGSPPVPPAAGPIHVLGGGGSASPALRLLADQGFELTAGALHLLDSDSETAEALGVPAAIEVPFAPLGEEARGRNRGLLTAARAIVVAPFAVGPSNVANLEDLLPFAGRVPILVLPRPAGSRWDFTSGEASALVDRLRAQPGVEECPLPRVPERLRTLLAPPGADRSARTATA
ncbi:MAG TPA: ABC transporter ATP-binding protein [Thermoplasmata archaeon]|nr:ABC transporter ATP-binding protein [Thermoplasmata archaeon]